MRILTAVLFFVLLISARAGSQSGKPSSAADLASYVGADRASLLLDGAKREGKVVWYTTLAAEQNKQIAGTPEGQKLLEDLFFGSARKDYGFKRWYPEKGGTLAQYEEMLEGWHKLLKEVTRKSS
jgi:hypothetical protein